MKPELPKWAINFFFESQISGKNLEVSIGKAIEVFNEGIGLNVNNHPDVKLYHHFAVPYCYERTLDALKGNKKGKFKSRKCYL